MGIAQKKFPEAIADLKKARELGGNPPYISGWLGHCFASTGRTNEAQQLIEHLKASGVPVATAIAFIYQGLGEKEQVFTWLDRAAPNPLERVRALKYDPLEDDVTTDPRYPALLKKHGLDK